MFQLSLFDGNEEFKITKPIRLIELFSGYSSQALALKYLGVPFEHYKTCEWAIKSIQACRDLHFGDDSTDYSAPLSKTEIVDYLFHKGISSNYSEPMAMGQIKRLNEDKLRTIYNNIQATHNLVSVCNAKGKDLEIVDTDKYCYVMTYSYPCQSLSAAGKRKGMEEGSGTTSSLLWEVKRLLNECEELPEVLIMENVPQCLQDPSWHKWIAFLESKGYYNQSKVLNANDFGIPQSRERCFMVSILKKDCYYAFPDPIEVKPILSEFLEKGLPQSRYLKNGTKIRVAKNVGIGTIPMGGGTLSAITCLLSNQGRNLDRLTDTACTIKAGDRGGENQSVTAVLYFSIRLGTSKDFASPPLYECSRTLKTNGDMGVLEWKI